MSKPGENGPIIEQDRPTIETVGQAAGEITRVYAVLDLGAVDLTSEYLQECLDGEEGVRWAMFPKFGNGRPTPILDSVMRYNGKILLGPAYNLQHSLLWEYRLSQVPTLIPQGDGTLVRTDAVAVSRPRRGYDPGDEYVFGDGKVLRAEYDHHGSIPTVGPGKVLAWTEPRDTISNRFREVAEIDEGLATMMGRLWLYEEVIE